MSEVATPTAATQDTIKCEICGKDTHAIQKHLETDHKDWSLELYQTSFPGAPLMSPALLRKIAEKSKVVGAAQPASIKTGLTVNTDLNEVNTAFENAPLHELFRLGDAPDAKNYTGAAIPVKVFNPTDADMVPDVDPAYVYDIENLRNLLMAFEIGMFPYLWGHTGVGKTTLIEQVCARTRRPWIRVQHTINTEESHIVGQRIAVGGQTPFELGPLPLAMQRGWTYVADEYDFALPSVLSVYQPVLEGKPLVIKEADAHNRVIRPHPNFRFVATGNTNGTGDETGLYQGTTIQNAANYDRFNMVMEVKYMKAALETQIVVNQALIAKEDAEKIVDWANRVRELFYSGKISSPVSPRTLIAAAKIGLRKGKRGGYRAGIELAFSNKMSRVDKEAVDGLAQRIFG